MISGSAGAKSGMVSSGIMLRQLSGSAAVLVADMAA
jgi:hypothetical protein